MKKIAIMQPYFMPYIGYFQLINSVDEFIIYDNIQYTKKGWINRNRILSNGSDKLITLPIKNGHSYLNVVDRFVSDTWITDKDKLINLISNSYKKADHFTEVFELISTCLNFKENNLFNFICNSLYKINDYLEIKTPIILSSSLDIDHSLKSQEKVLAICKNRKTDVYINSIGGVNLYDKEIFKKNKIDLLFIKTNPIEYKQFDNKFIPWMSIIDVLMFNSKEKIKNLLEEYTLT